MPRDVAALPINSTTFFVMWEATEFPNGLLRYYLVTYSALRSTVMATINTTDNSTSLLVDSLMPFTSYTVYVAGVTVAEGQPSTNVMVVTNEKGT